MKKINYALSFIVFVFTALSLGKLQAQDALFSQFYASPLHVNPALMGVFEGQMRFMPIIGSNGAAFFRTFRFDKFTRVMTTASALPTAIIFLLASMPLKMKRARILNSKQRGAIWAFRT